MFSLSKVDHLRREDSCTSTYGNNGDKIRLVPCTEDNAQKWKHDKVSFNVATDAN